VPGAVVHAGEGNHCFLPVCPTANSQQPPHPLPHSHYMMCHLASLASFLVTLRTWGTESSLEKTT